MITIITPPAKFMAAHNFIPYTISSDNTAQPNFNFVVDVNEVSGTSNPLARLVFPLQQGTSQVTFDIGNVVENYVQNDFLNATSALLAANTNSRLKYFCQFRELYDVSGIPTLSGVLVSDPTTPSASSYKVATNAIFDFETYSASAYTGLNVSGFGFLNQTLSVDEQITPSQNRILTFFDPNRIVTKITLTADGIGSVDIPYGALPSEENLFNINAGKFLFDLCGTISTVCSIAYLTQLGFSSLSTTGVNVCDNEKCPNRYTPATHIVKK
jgi:hypothetical protein